MRLESVEIVGFKSFCDRQEVSFGGGVTGIVGPNGCGKSNISDAINWVLGEQSVKSLRGSSMEDVIFAGSSSRQPLQMAEVNLKVTGLNGTSPNGHPDCVVTRRLYRNGDSEYLMNGKPCRLRDIHELFMDTGLGSKAYSIIEQGKIGQILSTKPADRRAIIEEAAGITKYKARRRQTQLRLEAAQQNLLRVNDIVNEVEKQLDSLKRQAAKARRWRAVRERLLGVERVVFGRRFEELGEQARLLDERLGAEAGRERAAAIALETEEAQLEARRHSLYELESLLDATRARFNELTLAVDRHQGRSGYCREQIAEAETRGREAEREAGELAARRGPIGESLAAKRAAAEEERRRHAAAQEEGMAAATALAAAVAAEAGREADLEGARETQVALLGRIADLRNARAGLAGAAERAGADLVKLIRERGETRGERDRVAALRDAALGRSREIEGLASGLRRTIEETRAREAEARARAEAKGREAESLQSERDSLEGRRASLEEMIATHSAFDEGVRALLARPEGLDAIGVLADALETDSAHERAVEAFLGDRLQAVLVPHTGEALRGVRWLQSSAAGRAALLALASVPVRGEDARLREIARDERKVLGLLSDRYRVSGPHADRIRAALPEALLVETLEDALEISARHGPLPVATLAGEALRGATVEGGRAVKGLLAPRREVREAASRLEEVDARRARARAEVAEATSAAEAAGREAHAVAEHLHAAEKDLVALRHELATASEEASRLERKRVVLETELAQTEEERGTTARRLAEIDDALVAAEAEREEAGRRLAALAEGLAAARSASEEARIRHAEAGSTLSALRERVAALEGECQRLGDDLGELEARIGAARGREEESAARRRELEEERAGCERMVAEALVERERKAAEVQAAEARIKDVRGELEAREAALKERRREREMLRDALSELEIARARNGSDLDHVARECQQAVGVSAAEAVARLSDEDRARSLDSLTSDVQELRDKLDRMGAVNVLAVEQTQELEERHLFLTTQRRDLQDSITELEQAIRKIDRASRERFQEAFQVINQHFGETFRQLFGGGTAGLSLLDETDLLESGIDIMAQPPGKRLQNVMLLSGGEKALTAIALLFAIFQYKPSPFCILDEVDAPLDDANIGRFVKMLEGLKEQTQFVLITHSRKTMQIADQLYGVTMEEPGVSKLVSVRFT